MIIIKKKKERGKELGYKGWKINKAATKYLNLNLGFCDPDFGDSARVFSVILAENNVKNLSPILHILWLAM